MTNGPDTLAQDKEAAPMLVLSRKKNDGIIINNDIRVTVVEIRGDKVRLAITAPADVPVHRQEVFDALYPGNSQPTSNSQPTWIGAPSVERARSAAISVDQL